MLMAITPSKFVGSRVEITFLELFYQTRAMVTARRAP